MKIEPVFQADVPAAVADALAEALYSRVPKVSDATTRGQVNNVSKSSITDEVSIMLSEKF